MATRSVDSGVVSLGLVNIPVKMYSTSDTTNNISLRLLHDSCRTPLEQQYYCPTHERTVARDEMVKGYEYESGKYVTFTNEELEAIAAESTKAIEISEFVPADDIDPIYYGKAYYLAPKKGGQKGYRLLSEALQRTGMCALAKYASRGNQYLVMLRPYEDGLVLQRLHYAEDVASFSEVPVGDHQQVSERELDLALQLIDEARSDTFEPEMYHDEVRDRLEEIIEQRIEGEEAPVAPAEEEEAEIIDLIEALQSTLEQYERRRTGSERQRRRAS